MTRSPGGGGSTTDVTPATLSAASSTVSQGAAPIEAAGFSLTGVTCSQPGFQTPEAVTSVCSQWASSFSALANEMAALAAKLQSSSATYDTQEQTLQQSYGGAA